MKAAVKAVPDAYQTLIPYFAVSDAAALLEFVKAAFGAVQGETTRGPDGAIRHSEARIGDCVLMVGQSATSRPNTTYMYVPDVDAAYRRAMSAPGAAMSLRTPTDEWYGDRSAAVEDAWGNQWWLASHIEDMSSEELERRAAAVKR
ncbi:MAG: VOC family protein [Steroidobacteraceae bacterium]